MWHRGRGALAFVAAVAFLISDHTVAFGDVLASKDGTDAFVPYFGIWEGRWRISSVGTVPEERTFTLCIGGRSSTGAFGWMNNHILTVFGHSNRDYTKYLRELTLTNERLLIDLTSSSQSELHVTLHSVGEKLEGVVEQAVFSRRDQYTWEPNGVTTLTKIKQITANRRCPSAKDYVPE